MSRYIKDIVEELVKKYKTNDPFVLAECLNINVVKWDLHPDILGFYKYEKQNKWIFLNSNTNEKDQSFTCRHEIGHVVLHSRINTPHLRKDTMFSINRLEREANTFAVELMIPDNLWLELSKAYPSFSELENYLGLPEEILRIKQKLMG